MRRYMRRYMLDADTVSYALRGQGHVPARLLDHQPSELCMSAITLAELAVLPFDEASAERFGVLGAALSTRGQPIGLYDTRVASPSRIGRRDGAPATGPASEEAQA
jgi:predicted nucleic acid-binding protein